MNHPSSSWLPDQTWVSQGQQQKQQQRHLRWAFYKKIVFDKGSRNQVKSSERDSPKYFQSKPNMIWIPIGLKGKVWFGNTLGYPSRKNQ